MAARILKRALDSVHEQEEKKKKQRTDDPLTVLIKDAMAAAKNDKKNMAVLELVDVGTYVKQEDEPEYLAFMTRELQCHENATKSPSSRGARTQTDSALSI
jgi:hypothetical protein